MAKKKVTAKQKQKALAKARKDGKVSAKEARSLRSLGISAKKITNTTPGGKGKVKVTGRAKQLAKPKPTPSPSSPTAPARAAAAKVKANAPTPTPTPSRSNNIFEQKATGGNKFLTGKQANQVLKLVKDPQRLPSTANETTDREGNVTTSTTPGDIDFESIGGERLINKALRGLSAQGININDISSQNDLNKIKDYVRPLATRNNNGLPGGDRATGEYNDIVNVLRQDAETFGQRGDKYRDLLKNSSPYSPEFVAMAKELGRIPGLEEIDAATKGIGGKNTDKAYGKFIGNLNKATGKGQKKDKVLGPLGGGNGLSDNALNPFAFTNSFTASRETKNIGPTVNGIGELAIGATAPAAPTAPVGAAPTAAATTTAPEAPTGTAPTAADETNPYASIISGLESQIADLSLQTTDLGDLADGFAASNTFLSDQAAASAEAYAAAEKRATNLANAFVPNANPNANSISYGDYRKRNRRKEDNQLSDLAILSDVGNATDPLAGLQLA